MRVYVFGFKNVFCDYFSTRTTNGGSYNNMEGGPGGPTSDSGGGGGPGGPDGVLTCCLVENGRPCTRLAGNACYSKKIQKTVAQKKLKLYMNDNVRIDIT